MRKTDVTGQLVQKATGEWSWRQYVQAFLVGGIVVGSGVILTSGAAGRRRMATSGTVPTAGVKVLPAKVENEFMEAVHAKLLKDKAAAAASLEKLTDAYALEVGSSEPPEEVAGPVAPGVPVGPGTHVYGTDNWISELERVVTLEAPRLDKNVQEYVYEGASLEYLMYLKRIWAHYQPGRAFQKKDKVWDGSGFGWQQKDPCSDFRGTGALGLKGIAYFWDKHTEDAHKLWDNAEKFPDVVPVATQFSNFCHVLLQMMKGIDPREKVTRKMLSKSVDRSSPLVILLDNAYRQSHNDEQPFYELVGAILEKMKTICCNKMLDPNYMEMPILKRAIVEWIVEYVEELHNQGKSFADLKKALKQDKILYNFRGTHGHDLIAPGTPTWFMLGQQPPIDLNNLESKLKSKIGCLKRCCAGCCCVDELSESQQIAKNALKSGKLETVLGKLRFMGKHGYRFDFPGTYDPAMITIG